jgi:hypothetical protein
LLTGMIYDPAARLHSFAIGASVVQSLTAATQTRAPVADPVT